MNRSEGRTPLITNSTRNPKPYNGFDCSARSADTIEIVKLRLEGVFENIKDGLSHIGDPSAPDSQKLFFCARGVDTLLRYLSEPESGEAAT